MTMTETNLLPEEVHNFRRIGSDIDLIEEEIPVTPKNRKLTDKYFLIAYVGVVVLTISLMIYTLHYSDIRRLKGYDNCGNICGQKNKMYPEWECTGKDMTNKPLLLNGSCTEGELMSFKDMMQKLNDIKDEYKKVEERMKTALDDDVANDADDPHDADDAADAADAEKKVNTMMELLSPETFIKRLHADGYMLALATSISLGLYMCIVLLLRYATRATVWTILILSSIVMFGLCIKLWRNVSETGTGVFGAIVMTLTWLCMFCVTVFMRKRMRLVILILKESIIAIFSMPSLFCISILITLVSIGIYIVFFVSLAYMFSSGKLMEQSNGKLEYSLGAWKYISMFFSLLTAIWSVAIIYGIQYMIQSGAIAKWYFSKDKTLLGNPVCTSTYVTLRFHLGTIAVRSVLITSVSLIKIILHFLTRNAKVRALTDCFMRPIMIILGLLSRSAYVMTAIHGTSFYKSGRKAAQLLTLNKYNVLVLSYTAWFVIRVTQISAALISVIITMIIFVTEDTGFVVILYTIIVFVISTILSWSILGPIETAVETIFLCFCEDCAINENNNADNPYAMSRRLMEFFESTKKDFAETNEERGPPRL